MVFGCACFAACAEACLWQASARVVCGDVCSLWTVLTCYACHCIALCKAPISFPPRPQQHGTAMVARIGATKVQGFRKGYLVDSNLLSIWAKVNSKLLHHMQSQGVSSLASHTNSQEERGETTGVLAGEGSG